MKGLVGGPLLVGGLGPEPPASPPLKSGPVNGKQVCLENFWTMIMWKNWRQSSGRVLCCSRQTVPCSFSTSLTTVHHSALSIPRRPSPPSTGLQVISWVVGDNTGWAEKNTFDISHAFLAHPVEATPRQVFENTFFLLFFQISEITHVFYDFWIRDVNRD